jgi:hypothetical protein
MNERIISFADIDTRRALGIYRKLPKLAADFTFRKLPPTSFRYFASLKKMVYINFDETYDVYQWEVYDNIEPMDDAWLQGHHGRHRGVWRGRGDFKYFDVRAPRCPIYFAGQPDLLP